MEGLQSSMVTPSSSIRILRSYSKRSSTTITQKVDTGDGEITGKQMQKETKEKRNGRGIKGQQQVINLLFSEQFKYEYFCFIFSSLCF